MELHLTREVNVESFVALAQIGIPSQREEILAVLKLATQHGSYVKAENVNTELLGRPAASPHGARILMLIESFGLLQATGTGPNVTYMITELGIDNLRKGEVMIPEEGSYVIYATEDSLMQEPILKVEPNLAVEKAESQAFFGRNADPKSQSAGPSMERPAYLDQYSRGHIFRQAANANMRIQINNISDRVARSSKRLRVEVTLELERDKPPRMKVISGTSETDSREVYAETTFDMHYYNVLGIITRNQGSLDLSTGEPVLLIDGNGLTPREAETFRKKVSVKGLNLGGFGLFEDVNMDLPILPASRDAAILWGNLLLERTIASYVDEEDYNRIKNETAARFNSKFDTRALASSLVNYDEMAHRTVQIRTNGDESGLFWYINAPRDLTAR